MKYLVKINREADTVAEKVLKDNFLNQADRQFCYEDAAILGLLENIINQVKSLEILNKHNHNTSVDVILRAIFENYIYLKFILEQNTALRGKAYQYSIRLSEFAFYDKLTDKTLQSRKLREFIDVSLDTLEKMYGDETDADRRNKMGQEYISLIGMQRLEQKWYNLDGKTKTLKALCATLKKETEYDFIYTLLSKEAHGKDAMEWFDLKEFYVAIKKSNTYKDNLLHIQVATKYLIESVKAIYNYYNMKEKLKHFETMTGLHMIKR